MKKLWRNSCSKVAQNIVLDNAFLWRPLSVRWLSRSSFPPIILLLYTGTLGASEKVNGWEWW